jgi:hypothetical protein
MWESHEDFDPALRQVWDSVGQSSNTTAVCTKLEKVSKSLSRWNATTFGSVRKGLKELRAELERQRSVPGRVGPTHAEIKVCDRIVELQHREEVMWRQRSRIQWLTEGDRNTHFFHQRASRRKKKNKITKLQRVDGTTTEDIHEISEMSKSFFGTLYESEGTHDMARVLDTVPRKVTRQMNEDLMAAYTEEEVKIALFQMYPTKAPGPDGYPAHFFQQHWDLCGKEVTDSVLRILRGIDNPEEINNTFIVLIPKVASPLELGQFRPISLCNVIYKIASKVIANRLKRILPEIISQEQSAFFPGRLITDNIIAAYECLHFMKRNGAKKHQHCALKLDMRKAYDRVEWAYLEAIMQKLGFHTS